MGRVAVSCSLSVLLVAGGVEFPNALSSFAYAADGDPGRTAKDVIAEIRKKL